MLDVDQHGPAGNGFAAFNQLKRAGLIDGAAALVATPSGGLHAYFAGSDQHSGKLPRHHLDFRAQGGYIVAPPSQVGGRPYQVDQPPGRLRRPGLGQGHRPARTRNATRHLQPAGVERGDLSHLAAWVRQQHEGNRNDGLFWAACRAAEAGDETVLAELATAARSTGLPDREIAATIKSARRTAGRPC